MSYRDAASVLNMDYRALLTHTPQNEMCISTLELAHRALPKPVFNHSFRVYLFSRWLAAREAVAFDDVSLFMACICHDLGASDMYNGEQRFEVEGADAACDIMKQAKSDENECHKVWTAIALHTSPGIAERIDSFTRLVRVGVKMDFSLLVRESYEGTSYGKEIEEFLPRLNVEKVLADSVVKQARKIPEEVNSTTWPDSEKHPKASWPGILLRAHIENPGWDGINHAF